MLHGSDRREVLKASDTLGKYSFQPLLFAFFCLLLVVLFFVTALMDVRRTQNTLLDVFQNKGMTIVETVETIAMEKFVRLGQITGQDSDIFQNPVYMNEGFKLQEAILGRLIELAREVDQLEETNRLPGQVLEKLAVDTMMQAVVICDESGEIIQKSAQLPKASINKIERLIATGDEIGADFGGEIAGEESSYMLTVRRKNNEGSIALVLGAEGFQYWAMLVTIQMAIDEGVSKNGVHYFMVLDFQGFLLAGDGDFPEPLASGNLQTMGQQIALQEDLSGYRITPEFPDRLEVYTPLEINGKQVGIAWIGLGIEGAVRLRNTHQRRIYVTTGVMVLGAVLTMLLYYRLQNSHFRRINTMTEKLSHAERLASLGKLAAGVAHEIRNPLNAISIAVQRVQREFLPDEPESKKEFSHIIKVVKEEISRLNQIIEDFVGPARVRRVEFRMQRLQDLLEQVVGLAREEASMKNIDIECRCQEADLMISMDSIRMHQALFNLIKNSLEAIEGPGTITVTARRLDLRHIVITISDTGFGISPDDVKRILDFEYTTKEKGLGLGLPIANEIIKAHGGKLRIESEPEKGTMLELTLPTQS